MPAGAPSPLTLTGTYSPPHSNYHVLRGGGASPGDPPDPGLLAEDEAHEHDRARNFETFNNKEGGCAWGGGWGVAGRGGWGVRRSAAAWHVRLAEVGVSWGQLLLLCSTVD